MNPLTQGLYISLLGLLVTFLALGIFILVMIVLKRIFPYKPEEEESEAEEPAVEVEISGGCDDMTVAAIAVAIARTRLTARGTRTGALGASLSSGRGPWGSVGRHSSRLSNSLIKK